MSSKRANRINDLVDNRLAFPEVEIPVIQTLVHTLIMSFHLQIHQDDEPLKRRSLGPPPDFQSRGFRLRLMTLFAALVLVLVLIKEAGKPERWEWMGFDRPVAEESKPKREGIAIGDSSQKTITLPAQWKEVRDSTAVGHVGDAGAWAVAWRQVDGATLADLAVAEEVQRIQLMAQPDSYRGHWIKFRGWVRTGRFVDRPITALQQDSIESNGEAGHYEFWIRPEETNAGPYCVYALQLPAGFPEVTDSFEELHERVEVAGCFFKNRSYVAADSSPSVCPLVLAACFTRLEKFDEIETTNSGPWMPNAPSMIGIVIFLILLAASLAWLAKKFAQTTRYKPGSQATVRIHDSLDQLSRDQSVMTNKEKIGQLQRSLELEKLDE